MYVWVSQSLYQFTKSTSKRNVLITSLIERNADTARFDTNFMTIFSENIPDNGEYIWLIIEYEPFYYINSVTAGNLQINWEM